MERLFGTNGIREVVGERLTAPFVTRVVSAIAAMVAPGPPILVGWDGRTSSPAFARITSSTLALSGHRVIEVGVLPTPAIQFLVLRHHAQLGVIITASHNPPEFNGLKCIAADGLEVTRTFEEGVEVGFERNVTSGVPYTDVGDVTQDRSGANAYITSVLAQVDARRIAERKMTVVLDCGNGASTVTSPTLLRRLGCTVITLNGHLDGTFPGHLSEPTEANLRDLIRTVPALKADLGIAHDGDADRAVFVDGSGRFVPGEEILALLARDAVERNHGGIVVTPVSASQAVEDSVRPFGGSVVYTRVGSPTVTRAMLERHAVFGGEENGGLVFPKHQLARDGAMTAAAVLDFLARKNLTLAEALRDIPRYALVKEKVSCPVALREQVLARVAEAFAKDSERIVTIDGVKAYREGGWVLLRPSGTEPIFRVFAESRDPARAWVLAESGLAAVRKALEELGAPG
jgi:phosphomannomutase / phosphoglucomutase